MILDERGNKLEEGDYVEFKIPFTHSNGKKAIIFHEIARIEKITEKPIPAPRGRAIVIKSGCYDLINKRPMPPKQDTPDIDLRNLWHLDKNTKNQDVRKITEEEYTAMLL